MLFLSGTFKTQHIPCVDLRSHYSETSVVLDRRFSLNVRSREKRAWSRTDGDWEAPAARRRSSTYCQHVLGASVSAVWLDLSCLMMLRLCYLYLLRPQVVSETWEDWGNMDPLCKLTLMALSLSVSPHCIALPSACLINACWAVVKSLGIIFSAQIWHFPKGGWGLGSSVNLFWWSTYRAILGIRWHHEKVIPFSVLFNTVHGIQNKQNSY